MDTQDTDTVTEAAAPAEYPKMLYKGGSAYDGDTGHGVGHQHTRVVADADEEQEARDEGYSEAQLPEGGEDTVEGSDGAETVGGEGGPETVEGQAGADSVEGAAGADSVAGAAGADTVGGAA